MDGGRACALALQADDRVTYTDALGPCVNLSQVSANTCPVAGNLIQTSEGAGREYNSDKGETAHPAVVATSLKTLESQNGFHEYTRKQLLELRTRLLNKSQSQECSRSLLITMPYTTQELDESLVQIVAAGQLAPSWFRRCSTAGKRSALMAALRGNYMHAVFAMQPRSERFRDELMCIELDETFLLEAMTMLCKDAVSADADRLESEPIAWLLERGAPLGPFLAQQQLQVRLVILKLLAKIGPDASVNPMEVVPFARDRDARIRRAAIEALGNIHITTPDPQTSLVFAQCLEDVDPMVRESTARALGHMGDLGISIASAALNHESENVRGLAARAVGLAGQKGAPYASIFASWLQKESVPLQVEAVQALGLVIGASEAHYILALAAQAEVGVDESIREAAIKALGHLGVAATPHVEVIASALDDPNPFVQEAAAVALGSIAQAQVA